MNSEENLNNSNTKEVLQVYKNFLSGKDQEQKNSVDDEPTDEYTEENFEEIMDA